MMTETDVNGSYRDFFQALSKHFPGRTYENHKNIQSGELTVLGVSRNEAGDPKLGT
jgi:hypothetical protein